MKNILLELKDHRKERIFLEKLEQRYIAEHSKIYEFKHEHKTWWLHDQGTGRETKFLDLFRLLEQFVGSLKDKYVVDMGCGSGASLVALSALGAKAVGLENDSYGSDLALAKLRCDIYGFNPQIVNADAIHSPLENNLFDLLISTSVVEHIKNYEDYLKELNRILKPGGFAYINTNNRFWPYDSHSGLYFFNWLPHRIFELARNIKYKYPLGDKFQVWHISNLRFKSSLKSMGFKIITDWSKFYVSRNKSGVKQLIIRKFLNLGLNPSIFAPNNEFLVQKCL